MSGCGEGPGNMASVNAFQISQVHTSVNSRKTFQHLASSRPPSSLIVCKYVAKSPHSARAVRMCNWLFSSHAS